LTIYLHSIVREPPPMPLIFVMRAVLKAVSAVLGGFGVFYAIMSFPAPALSGLALVLIGAALGITYCLDLDLDR
jgi:hypothetical protein